MNSWRCEGAAAGGEAEEAGDAGEHVEDDNRRAARASHEAPEEVGHVGAPRAPRHGSRRTQIGDVQGTQQLRAAAAAGEDSKRTVTGSGRFESEGGGIHQ